MLKLRLEIWGREFLLNVVYQNYPGEEVTELQKATVEKLPEVDFSAAEVGTKNYIEQYFATELGNDTVDNLFRFVMPQSILVARTEDVRIFALMCDFKLDVEHGIAIVYKDEQYVTAGPQDLIL